MRGISVIIVNYNGRQHLADVLVSLAQQTRPPDEVILVDNASRDGSADYVEQQFPWVRVVRSQINVGYAEGTNIGLASASCDYIALLNPDAVADARWLAELERCLLLDERVGAVVSKIYVAGQARLIEQIGTEFSNSGHCWARALHERDTGQYDVVEEVPGVAACAMMLRREALQDEPVFDGELFLFYEELDLTIRLRGRGWRILYVPTAIVHHKGSQSINISTKKPLLFKQFYSNRNRLKILAKYYPTGVLFKNLHLILASLAYWNAMFLWHGGPDLLLRSIAQQAAFAIKGVRERGAAPGVDTALWLPWMRRLGVREMLSIHATGQRRG